MIDIAANKFPFVFTDSEIQLPDFFKNNEDTKINNIKEVNVLKNIKANVSLDLTAAEFITFKNFIEVDTESTKKYFKAYLDIEGTYEEFICDIISNIKVNIDKTVNRFNVSFSLVIVSTNKILK